MKSEQPASSDDPSSPTREITPNPLVPEGETFGAVSAGGSATVHREVGSDSSVPCALQLPVHLPAPFGRYRLVKLLGRGGMGAVYLAYDSQLARSVALKIPCFMATDDPERLRRFLREARAAAALHHAHICPIYDAGEQDGIPYLTMGYVEGRSLAEMLRTKKQPLPSAQAAVLVHKLALALTEAHRHQVVHRDLKPENVMMTGEGEPILMDFGLARRSDDGDIRLTREGAVLGTPAYMAPEQARGDSHMVGPPCDIYSLGVLLYELLTLRLPFRGVDALAVLAKVMTEEPPPPSRFRPEVDASLEAICLKALAKNPAERHPTMAAFAAALTDYLQDAQPTLSLDSVTQIHKTPSPPGKGRKRWWFAASGVAVVLLGASAAFLPLRDNKPRVEKHAQEVHLPVKARADEPIAYAWPAGALRDGKIVAPDLSRIKPLLQDEFDDPTSGFPRGKTAQSERGYREGEYFIDLFGPWRQLWQVPLGRVHPAHPLGDFACQVVGRAEGSKTRWGLRILDHEKMGESYWLCIALSSSKLLHVVQGNGAARGKRLQEPATHPAIHKERESFDSLLVVLRGRHLEIYANQIAVCDPIFVDRAIPSPHLALTASSAISKGGTATFDRITVWPAGAIPSLVDRGALPQR